jgi:ankyrin repeat protein
MGLFSTIFGGKLTKAAYKGDAGEVELLLKNGANPNERQMGITALITACNRGHVDVVRILLEKGADVNAKDWEGWTALMAGAAGAAHDDNRNKEEKCLEIVRLLIAHGADVNQKGRRFQTALKDADDAGHKRVKELLIQHGATK